MADAHACFRRLRLATLLSGPPRPDWTARLPPLDTAVPNHPLRVGAATLAMLGIADDFPRGPMLPPFGCHVHTILDATVHSSAGIIGLRTNEALDDTLDHTDPVRDFYDLETDHVRLPPPTTTLPGRYLSLLLGNHENHYHWLLMSFARLALLQPEELADLAGILVPDRLTQTQRDLLDLANLPAPLRPVSQRETLRVGTLIMPWNAASGTGANPSVAPFLRALLPHLPPAQRRIYIDRRAAASRPLLNEAELVATLAQQRIDPVRLETLTIQQQARLMAEASLIIAPHGAGLTNIAFCSPGTRVIELMPSGAINWCYRHLAAACRHRYDCVAGRSLADGSWVVSPTHVLSALDHGDQLMNPPPSTRSPS